VSVRVLFVQQEWPREFRRSTQWSYISSLGYIEALEACGAEVTLLTTPWIAQAPALLAGLEFDQVWLIDLVHLEAPDSFFHWIREICPRRIGVLGESLRYSEEEIRDAPSLAGREQLVRSRCAHVTHLLFLDEDDARRFLAEGFPSLWLPAGMLSSLVIPEDEVRPQGSVGFIGDIYPKRARLFQDPRLQGRLVQVLPNDRTPEMESRYLELASFPERALDAPQGRAELHRAYSQGLMQLRREIYGRYLAAFQGMGATLNPPSFVKSYPGRVCEAIARGVPVITCRIPNRPGNDRLFAFDREILAFEDGDVDALCRAIDRVTSDEDAARQLALRARARLLADHTLEARCALALRFIEQHS
jgi:glycosyltransferase involved in cell wall biosynthesis